MRGFDACVLVVSNREQAAGIQELIDARTEAGLYPREIEFVVVSDPEQGRVGSGGATILVLRKLRSRIEAGQSLLVIHAGGESRRMPTFAAEGKLFAPIPASSSSTIPPVILDLQLSLFLKYPWLPGEVVLSSGDVVIDFDTELIPRSRGEIYGFAKSDSFVLGSQHGVFKLDRNHRDVVDFYQKETAEFLEENAALEGTRTCPLDLGIIALAPSGIQRFVGLSESRTASGACFTEALEAGAIYIDLYVEILTACLSGLSFEQYRSKVSRLSMLSESDLRSVFHAFEDVNLRATLVKRATFLHFGSLSEYPLSCEAVATGDIEPFYLGQEAEIRQAAVDGVLQFNSLGCTITPRASQPAVCVEGCRDSSVASAGGANLLSGLEGRKIECELPAGICIDERLTDTGSFLLAYHSDDTWKPVAALDRLLFCGVPFDRWLSERSLDVHDVFDGDRIDLYEARLWPADPTTSFIEGYWNRQVDLETWTRQFLASERSTLREVASFCSANRRELRRREIRSSLLRDAVTSSHGWLSMPKWDFRNVFSVGDEAILDTIYKSTDDDLVRLYRRELLRGLSADRRVYETLTPETVSLPQVDYLDRPSDSRRLTRGVKIDQIVWARAPVRLDLAGGWTDTPPYTLREGGEVVNLAVNLNGQPPIQVFCRATDERSIKIQSIDIGAQETIQEFAGIASYSDPKSPFALPKAALYLLGLTPAETGRGTLVEALEDVGCGLELTLLSAVPKGSGLGTSSIMAAAIVAALQRFFGLRVELGELIREVLQIEQMLTTGGGWQDQIGGVVGGVKYIRTDPGLRPEPIVYQLDPHLFDDSATGGLFTLYYTGVTRLAKNILQEVVDRVNSFEPAYLFTLRRLKKLARSARDAISLRDLSALSEVLRGSWSANKLIHPSTTNEEVEALLERVSAFTTGFKLLGAGGGGYVLFLSESAETASKLRQELSQPGHDRARIVDMTLNRNGLEVTVS